MVERNFGASNYEYSNTKFSPIFFLFSTVIFIDFKYLYVNVYNMHFWLAFVTFLIKNFPSHFVS